MKKIYFLLLTILMTSLSFSQGTETFDGFMETGSSYADGTFTGDDGSTWTYVQSRGDQSITGKSLMLGRNRTPQAEVMSGTITGGIGEISFNFQRTFSTNVNLNILVNNIVVGNVTSTDGTVQNSGVITVNQPGDVVIKFISVNNSDGQVTIDDVTWTGFTGTATPSLSVTSPSDNAEFPSGTTSVDVVFATANTNAGDQVNITVNGGTPALNVTSPYSITTADGTVYSVLVELVDSVSTVLDSETITFEVLFPCTLSLGAETSTCVAETVGIDTYNATLEFTGGNTSTYTIMVNEGTVGGDNPSTMAAGTITINGITEGTDLVVTITGDAANSSCDLSETIPSPTCVPSATCPGVGALIITEVMQNPSQASDPAGEYFEVYNTTGAPIDMIGWIIKDEASASETHTIGSSLIVPAMGYIVIGNVVTTAPTLDYNYANDISLGNGTDGVILECSGTDIDSVIWDNGATFPDPSGIAMELSITTLDGVSNDNGANWGEATSDLGNGDFGTPGAANSFTLSTEDFTLTTFSIYPNPTNTGFVNITTTSNEAVNITVFDVLGKEVLSQTVNNNSLNVSSLNTGVYILQLNQNGATATKKLVIK